MTGRYLLFMGEQYYPCGGWRDFAGAYGSVTEAMSRAERGLYTYSDGLVVMPQWGHIIDAETLQPVAAFDDYRRTDTVEWSKDPAFLKESVHRYVIESETNPR